MRSTLILWLVVSLVGPVLSGPCQPRSSGTTTSASGAEASETSARSSTNTASSTTVLESTIMSTDSTTLETVTTTVSESNLAATTTVSESTTFESTTSEAPSTTTSEAGDPIPSTFRILTDGGPAAGLPLGSNDRRQNILLFGEYEGFTVEAFTIDQDTGNLLTHTGKRICAYGGGELGTCTEPEDATPKIVCDPISGPSGSKLTCSAPGYGDKFYILNHAGLDDVFRAYLYEDGQSPPYQRYDFIIQAA